LLSGAAYFISVGSFVFYSGVSGSEISGTGSEISVPAGSAFTQPKSIRIAIKRAAIFKIFPPFFTKTFFLYYIKYHRICKY